MYFRKWSYYTKGLAVASGQSRVNLKEFLVYFKKISYSPRMRYVMNYI